MPQIRAGLERAGFDEVRTYLQSGNVVVTSDRPPDELAQDCSRLIADDFGLQIDAVARTRTTASPVPASDPTRVAGRSWPSMNRPMSSRSVMRESGTRT